MTDKVVQLNVVPVRGAPNEHAIARIEGFLAAARAGELTSVAIVGLQADGSMLTGIDVHDGDNLFYILGGIEYLKRQYVDEWIEGRS